MSTFNRPRPSPAVARAVWLWGARIMIGLWALVAVALLVAGELSAAGQAKFAGLFGLLLAGWTGAWLNTRKSLPAPVH
jgi:hypothetical protein